MPVKAAIQPFHNQVLLQEVEASPMVGKIIIPDKHVQKLNQGTVLDKGPLCSDEIQPGDIIFFPLHSEHRMEWRGLKLILVSEDQVLGAIRELKEGAPDGK